MDSKSSNKLLVFLRMVWEEVSRYFLSCDIRFYDSNLSHRLQIGLWRICVVVDWWYDRSSRVFVNWPLEVRFYFQTGNPRWKHTKN